MNLTVSQRERVDAVFKFAQTRLTPGARKREAEGRFDRELWQEAADFGLAGLPVPEE
jgi:alkylation response protein AidB-like acyl-CoA dehydrogenase